MSTEPNDTRKLGGMQALGLQFVLYLFVGGISAVLDIGGFLALQYAGIGYIAASRPPAGKRSS